MGGPDDKKSALVYTMIWHHLGDMQYRNQSSDLVCLHINASLGLMS